MWKKSLIPLVFCNFYLLTWVFDTQTTSVMNSFEVCPQMDGHEHLRLIFYRPSDDFDQSVVDRPIRIAQAYLVLALVHNIF